MSSNPKDLYNTLVKKVSGLNINFSFNIEQEIKFIIISLSDTIKKPKTYQTAIEVCSLNTIVSAVTKMFMCNLQYSKNQCYFNIDNRDNLIFQISYFGTVAMAKKTKVKDVFAYVYYKDEEVEFDVNPETGRTRILTHKRNLKSMDEGEILGAYAVIVEKSGALFIEIMPISEIKTAWSKTKSGGGVQKEFPSEMAKKTVIKRALKMFTNTDDETEVIDDETILQEKHEEIQTTMLLQEDVKVELEEIKIEDNRIVDEDGVIHDSIIYEENNTNKEDEEVDF